MSQLVERFVNSLEAKGILPSTFQQYRNDLLRFEHFLSAEYGLLLSVEDAGEIRVHMLDAYANRLYQRGLRPSTRNKYIVELKEFFGYLHTANFITADPSTVLSCVRKEPISPDKEQRLYTPEQLKQFLASISGKNERCNDRRDAAIIALIIASGGMRASEVCSLNVSDLEQIRSGLLYCRRKGGEWRYIEVAPLAAQYIDRYLEKRPFAAPTEPLFLSTHGRRLDRRTLWKSLAHKQRKAELATGIHLFRHMMLSEVEKLGGGAAARDIAGHKQLSTTNRYAHSTREERAQLVRSNAFMDSL